ncbi:MAG: LacI family DNA-binding transcriptional regulator [Clostridia bacterium]|nr:LacI family DNA-binding transcriptional regulator [Clostridia bacterium]
MKKSAKKAAKVTIKDLADAVGCSSTAVSRALNGKYGVSEKTRAKIRLEAMSRGYVGPHVRHGKKAGLRQCFSIVVTHNDLLDENFHRQLVYGIEQELGRRGLTSFLTTVESIGGQELPLNISRIRADGIFIIGQLSLSNVAALLSGGIPVVMVDTLYLQLKADRVTMNNYQGGYTAANYLISRGHTSVAFVGDPDYSFGFAERYRGFCDCMQKHGVPADQQHLVRTTAHLGTMSVDEEQMHRLLSGPGRPTALMCANDGIAFYMYRLCDQWGLRIPDDLSVIGFDNAEKSTLVLPPLTTISVPKYEIGVEAARLLLARLRDPQRNTRCIEMDILLEERASVRDVCAPASSTVYSQT